MSKLWKTEDFDYVLPKELIARYPLANRSDSRLMSVRRETGMIANGWFRDFLVSITPNDLLVFNDTKVIPARLRGYKITGGAVECLVERVLSEDRLLAQLFANRKPSIGAAIILDDVTRMTVVAEQDGLFELQLEASETVLEVLDHLGEVPLPPYLERLPNPEDRDRYQTVFAEQLGAVAAPTASLHFDTPMMMNIKARRIPMTKLTLHVGAGTFQPVRVSMIEKHKMHHEFVSVSQAACDAVIACQQRQGRVMAIGTTVMRALETASQQGNIQSFQGNTNLFIYPGFRFHCVDTLLTNFHWPKSSLLMLVSAFMGYKLTMRAYQQAINERYRFFSYGDAMFIQ